MWPAWLRRLQGGDSIGLRCASANLLNCKARGGEGGGGRWGSRRGFLLSGNSTRQFKALSSWFPFTPVKQTSGEMIPGSQSSLCQIRFETLCFDLCIMQAKAVGVQSDVNILAHPLPHQHDISLFNGGLKYALFLIKVRGSGGETPRNSYFVKE